MADLNAVANLLVQAAIMLRDHQEGGFDNEGQTEPVGPTHSVTLDAKVSGILDIDMAKDIIERELNTLAADHGLDVFALDVEVADL